MTSQNAGLFYYLARKRKGPKFANHFCLHRASFNASKNEFAHFLGSSVDKYNLNIYKFLLPTSALEIVASSIYSNSLPLGRPRARRVIFTSRGDKIRIK